MISPAAPRFFTFPLALHRVCATLGAALFIASAWAQSGIVGWGENWQGQTEPPPGLTAVVALAAGEDHSLALRADRTVVAWGDNFYGQTLVPADLTNVQAIAGGGGHSLALQTDGSIVAWGDNTFGQTNVPPGLPPAAAIAAGSRHSLALLADGSVMAWGDNFFGQLAVPAGLTNVVALSAAGDHSLAVRGDGSVVAWGRNSYGQTTVPVNLTNAVAVAAGADHSLALRANGTVAAWGNNALSQTAVPAGLSNVIAIAAGCGRSFALRADGTLAAWGSNPGLPAVGNVVALAGGCGHALALQGQGPAFLSATLPNRTTHVGGIAYFRAMASGARPLGFQWRFQGTNLPGATQRVLVLTNVQPSQTGSYSVTVSNDQGTATSSEAFLGLVPAVISAQPPRQVGFVGGNVTFPIGLRSSLPVRYQWRRDGAPVPGATNASLTLGNLQLADHGRVYSVEISNAFGVAVSADAALSVGYVAAWGVNRLGQTDVPAGLTDVVALAGGGFHSVALQRDGSVIAWGDDYYGQATVPAGLGDVVAIASGVWHNLALRADGSVAAWGRNHQGQATVPAGLSNVIAVAAGETNSLALRADGSVVAWGGVAAGQTNLLAGLRNVVAIAAGDSHSLALRADGQVAAWGATNFGQAAIPPGLSNVAAIAAGGRHNLALRADGSVTAWGDNNYDQTTVPAHLSNVVAIAGRTWKHSLALRADRTVAAWGNNWFGQTNVPAGLAQVAAVAGGGDHCLALIEHGLPFVATPRTSRALVAGDTLLLQAAASGAGPLSFQWQLNGTNLPAATNASLRLANVHPTQAGTYRLIVTNPFGRVTNAVANVSVAATFPVVWVEPQDLEVAAGDSVQLSVQAEGAPPLRYQWYFINAPLAGATAGTLRLTGVQTAQTGDYRVVISNAFGTVTSRLARLTVIAPRYTNAPAPDFQWATRVAQTTSVEEEDGVGLALTPNGNVYLASAFAGTNDFGGSALASFGGQDVFVSRHRPAGTLAWAQQAGSTNITGETARAVRLDAGGKVHVTGTVRGSARFGSTNLNASPRGNFFLARYTPAGALEWVSQAKSANGESFGTSLAVDAASNCIVVGCFSGPGLNFPGLTLTNAGSSDFFIAKYDPTGALLWAKRLGGLGVDRAARVVVDGAGACYVAGSFSSTVAFDSTHLTSAGERDLFLAKFSSSGTLRWVRQAGGAGDDQGLALAMDSATNLFVGGSFTGTNRLGATPLISAGGRDAFLAKYDRNGGFLWAVSAGGPNHDTILGAAVDAADQCYVTGPFTQTAVFGTSAVTNAGGMDIFVAKYGGTGGLQWVLRAGGTNDDVAAEVAVNSLGELHVSGWFQGTAAFGTNLLRAAGARDVFLAKLDALPAEPVLLSQPQAQTTLAGSAIVLSITATGAPPLRYQWFFQNAPLAGATNAALSLANLLLTQGGAYNVVVSNARRAVTSAVAVVTVTNGLAPMLVAEPEGQTVLAGATVVMAAAAQGTPPLRYQWYFQEAPLAGATNSTLTLTNLQPSQAGAYRVVAQNAFGSAASRAGHVVLRSAPEFQWARRVTTITPANSDPALGLAVNAAGRVHLTGSFEGTNDFGGQAIASFGGPDVFLSKHAVSGALSWVQQAGGTGAGFEAGHRVAVDTVGRIYVTGGVRGTAKFGSTTNLSARPRGDFFLAKYTAAGAVEWVRQAQSPGGTCHGTGVAVDTDGDILVVGYYDGSSISFGPITLTKAGAFNSFVVRYDRTGTPLWAQNLSGPGENSATTIALDNAGNGYVAGSFSNTLSVGTLTLVSAGLQDAFLLKFNRYGTPQWARQAGGAGSESGHTAVEGAGNAYLVGSFSGTLDFGSVSLSSTGASALFIARYDTAGALQWVRKAEGAGRFLLNNGGCATDSAGNGYIAGMFDGRVDFDGLTVASRGGWDAFVASYGGAGNFRWAQTAGGPGDDAALRVAVDAAQNAYVAGWIEDAAAFGTHRLQAVGSRDIFVAKLPAPAGLILRRAGSQAVFTLTGEAGGRYAVEYAPTVGWANGWLTLTNVTLTNNLQPFTDSLTSPQRFYRLRRLPP